MDPSELLSETDRENALYLKILRDESHQVAYSKSKVERLKGWLQGMGVSEEEIESAILDGKIAQAYSEAALMDALMFPKPAVLLYSNNEPRLH